MFKTGTKIHTIKNKMKKLSWIKFHAQLNFDTGETNLIYYNGVETLCFYFDEHKRLIKAV